MQDKGWDASSAPDDDMSDGAWMTYSDLAKLRGINSASAFKLALRRKWRRQKNNMGQMTVFVPATWSDTSQDNAHDASHQGETFETALTAIREAHAGEITALRERAVTAERRTDQAEAARQAAEARADRAEQGRDGERARADAERTRADGLVDQLRVAQVEFAKAEAEGDALAVETAELTAQVKAARIAQAEAEADAAELRRMEAARRGRGRLARVLAAWRGNSDDGR